MVIPRENSFEKAVQMIADFERQNRLLPSSEFATLASGDYLKTLKNKLRIYGIADSIAFKGNEFWFPIRLFNEAGRQRLEQHIEKLWAVEQKQKRAVEQKEKNAEKIEFIKNRKTACCIPTIKCGKCAKELQAVNLWQQGSLTHKKFGYESFAGSVTCSKCGTQNFYGMFLHQLSKTNPDKTFQQGKQLNCSNESLLPAELNEYFSKLWQDQDNRGDFIFK